MEKETSFKIVGTHRHIQTAPLWMVWLWKFLRIVFGAIFIYASADKIMHPEQFAYMISNYKILPMELINFVALFLPWLEAVVGIFLIFGLFEWVSLTLFNGLMMAFMVVIVISLVRGLNISCGCFSSDPNAEKMTWLTLFRDASFLIPGLGAYFLLVRLR